MDETGLHIDIKDLIKIVKKRFYVFIAILLVVIGAAIFYRVQLNKPSYEAKASLIIGHVLDRQNPEFQIDDVGSNQVYMQTYVMILKTNIVAEKTIQELGLNISADELKKHIHAIPHASTQFLEIKIRWGNPQEASLILDKMTEVFIQEALRVYPTYTIQIMEKIRPRMLQGLSDPLFYALTLAGSFLLSFFVLLVTAYLDNTMNTEEDIERYLHVPVVGTIPKQKDIETNILESLNNNEYRALEAFRTLRTNLYYISRELNIKTLVVTSARPMEGKSTAASLLAVVLAQGGKRTLLIDCDLRKPTIHQLFNIPKVGLSNCLMNETIWSEVVSDTDIDNLSVLPAGFKPLYPVELISSVQMKELLMEVQEAFDYIILDTPPVGLVAEAQVLSQFTDGYLLVVSSGESNKNETIKAQKLIYMAQGKILGVLLNKVPDLNLYKKYSQYYQ